MIASLRMKTFTSFPALILAGCASVPVLPDRAPPLALSQLNLAPWRPSGRVERYGRDDLELVLGATAQLCLPYEIEEMGILRARQGESEAEASLYRCRSCEESFGLYSAFQAEAGSGRALSVGEAGAAREGAVDAWKGRYYLRVRSVGAVPAGETELAALARSIIDCVQEASRKPALVRALPVEHLLPGSELCFKTAETLALVWRFPEPDLLRLGGGTGGEAAGHGIYAQYMFAAEAHLFVLVHRDVEVAAQVADHFVRQTYGKDAKTYTYKDAFREVQRPGGAWALSYHSGRLALLVPPTRARDEIKGVIRRYVENLARLAKSA